MSAGNRNLFCRECSSLLYPKADTPRRVLLYACRSCDYSEEAETPCVYRNDLIVATREVAGLVKDIVLDPTLPRSNIECPRCHLNTSVYFQGQGKRTDTKMTLFFVCCNCEHAFQDPQLEAKRRDDEIQPIMETL